MKRGEIWTLRDRDFASKARPVVIVQADIEGEFDSIILCLLTTVEKNILGEHIGSLTNAEMRLISGKLAKILEIHKSDIEE